VNGKALWGIIFGLVVINCLTIAYFTNSDKKEVFGSPIEQATEETDEVVAQIGDVGITRQEWLAELEKNYGKTTLENMINIKVVEELAKKNKIEVSEDVINQELQMFKATYNAFGDHVIQDEETLKNQIKYSILLEELLTKDVVVPEGEMKQFYENNKHFYQISPAYHISQIVVETEEEAKQIMEELKDGSSFQALAAERSIDQITASHGGNLGFIPEDSEFFPEEYIKQASQLKENQFSTPIKTNEGFVIIYLHEKLEGAQYSYDQVKNQIRRQLALEQMKGNVSAKKLWEDIGVTWFYGESE